jgi:hypothetical protein
VPRCEIQRLRAAANVVRVEAAVLGVVTFAANNHSCTVTTASGASVTTVQRDAVKAVVRPDGVPARPWRKRASAPPPEPRAVSCGPMRHELASPRAPAAVDAALRRRVAAAQAAAADDFVLRDILATRHAGAIPVVSPHGDGVARFGALRARVAARACEAAASRALSLPRPPDD